MNMSNQSYLERMGDVHWAPGWEAILEAFATVYEAPGDYLPVGQLRGLSRIYPHPEAYSRDTSGRGVN